MAFKDGAAKDPLGLENRSAVKHYSSVPAVELSLFFLCLASLSLSLSFSFLDMQSKKKKKLPENLQSLDLYDLCGGDTKLVSVGLVLLYFGLLLALTVAKNGQFCSHAHGNLILDI